MLGFSINDFELNPEGGRSAAYDLTLYDKNDKMKQFNIEFKALLPTTHSIAKDFFKLFVSRYDGLFFHILKNVNNETINALNKAYSESIKKVKEFGKYIPKDGNISFWILNLGYLNERALANKKSSFQYYYLGTNKLALIDKGIEIKFVEEKMK